MKKPKHVHHVAKPKPKPKPHHHPGHVAPPHAPAHSTGSASGVSRSLPPHKAAHHAKAHKPAHARKPKRPVRKQPARKLSPGYDLACCSAEAVVTLLRLSGWPVTDADTEALYWMTAEGPDDGATIGETLWVAGTPRFGLDRLELAREDMMNRNACDGCPAHLLGSECGDLEISGLKGRAADFEHGQPDLIAQVHGLILGMEALPYGHFDGLPVQSYTITAGPFVSSDRDSNPGFQSASEKLALILGLALPEGPHAVLATADGWWSWGELYDPSGFPGAVIEEAWAVTW